MLRDLRMMRSDVASFQDLGALVLQNVLACESGCCNLGNFCGDLGGD
jgi:hypothetical protein